MRAYADMTGSLVSTSGQVGSTAISAAEDSSAKRAVAIIGDDNGYTGAASVTFSGLASVPWLASNGSVNVTVDRIPDQYPLSAPQVVLEPEHERVRRLDHRAAHLPGLARRVRHLPDARHIVGRRVPERLPPARRSATTACAWTCSATPARRARRSTSGPATASPTSSSSSWPASGGYGELQAQNSGDDVTVSGSSTAAGHAGHRPAARQRRGEQPVAAGGAVRRLVGVQELRQRPVPGRATAPAATSASNSTSGPCKNAPGTNQDFTPR